MVKNGLSNLMKYIFFVTLVTVLSFSFTKVDCFAVTFDGGARSYVNGSPTYAYRDAVSFSVIYFWSGSDQFDLKFVDRYGDGVYYLATSIPNSKLNAVIYSNFTSLGTPSSSMSTTDPNFPGLYFWNTNIGFYLPISPYDKEDYPYTIPIYSKSSFDENIHRIQFDVYYNTPWLLNNSVVVQCLTKPFNDVLNNFDHFDFELTDDDGTIIWSESIPRGMFNNNGLYRIPDVFEHENIETQNCFYKITPYATNGDWGITSTGSFYVGTNQSGEPLDNPYLVPSVNGTDIVGTVPVISTTVEDKDVVPSSYLSSSNLPNITYNINNYYVYDTSDPSSVPSGTTEDTYVDYTINTIDIPQGDPDLFSPVQDYYDSEYKNKVSGILSVFQNLFPFLPDGLIKGLSFLLAVIIGLIVVLIAIKLIGLIL